MTAEPQTSANKDDAAEATPKMSPQRLARQRLGYIDQRMIALREEAKALVAERAEVQEKLGAETDVKSPEAVKLRQRRAYLLQRPKEARAEIAVLATERKELSVNIRL